MKEMCILRNNGSCPICGHSQFVVIENQINISLTDIDGNVLETREAEHEAHGKCVFCGNECEMLPTTYGFIPLSPLRKFLYKEVPQYIPKLKEYQKTENPMQITTRKDDDNVSEV